ncbi:MAG: 5-formyltetrahydrofolate cyclo-ligase [Planctomycetaceae bacterium]|nr:5-formyltetrahydrofolate cyclo-ligase [Planctomycetaceae bacterium]
MKDSKETFRTIVAERKQVMADSQSLSQQVMQNLQTVPEFVRCNMLMTYVDFGKEVRTLPLIKSLIKEKRIVIPYCEQKNIHLFLLKKLDELAVGYFGILEPKIELRRLTDRKINADELQVILVPGVAFDRQGGRVGRGGGYYDRFLEKLPKDTLTIGLAFDFQVFDEVPMTPKDQRLNLIVSETAVYRP